MVRAIDTGHRLTFEEYVTFEETCDGRHDYVDGHLYAFAGSSARHSLILGNVVGTLGNRTRGSGSHLFSSRMMLRVSSRIAYYPDVMVACDPNDRHERYRTNPCLIVEVLSPSTLLIDRREKVINYQSIASLQGYIVVYRDEQRVESSTRNRDGVWVYQNLTGDQDVWFPCVDVTVPVLALYEDVDMSPFEPDPDEPDIR